MDASAEDAAEESQDDRAWAPRLPMRFNAPPGWKQPDLDWVQQHMGLEMSPQWTPAGAGSPPPDGWQWWIPQEPAWSEWIARETRNFRRAIWGCSIGAVLATALAVVTLRVNGVVFGIVVLVAVIAVVGVIASLLLRRKFRQDPMSGYRDLYLITSPAMGAMGG